ncbi:Abi/CAAX domain protein (plasmid) [Natrialba magadii ATCC 43099]|uniref:Abi/CAAX domain protein n=1 Tax=Natrialba magadii (strain ATCC 43099 / DSM 3394 / CCM 3739 / CIP 104546 / IAM 13178 / JCM 8861 / NBRC 102185 / NCIMB 2190 / MS3) TaxID=547559 RepID=D3T1Z5_NATMM|nr:CPBP family intramembrane glutamic endopeptidase [Natrialba magadii]ADD07604.1 Abi/CAAX domain protein [Natrialba magadii ATCC 43099]ELY27079.1 abortive infection protein [Natrialba magadii ATCC 43099]
MTATRRSLLAFVLLTFLISWTPWGILVVLGMAPGEELTFDPAFVLFAIGGLGPPIAAVVVTQFTEGGQSTRQLLRRLLRWRVGSRWYGVAVLLPGVFVISAILLDWLILGVTTPLPTPDLALLFVGMVIVNSMFAGLEEIGWRGFALPRLQSSLDALTASLVIGVVWLIWHAPLMILPGAVQTDLPALPYAIQTIALAVLFTWLYNSTRGSLLLVVLLHGSFNAWIGSILLLRDDIDPFTYWVIALVVCVITIGVIAVYGTEHLSRIERQTA